ncbi:hypothetical protein BV898_04256 [Hypsibius exemplaris]|uniref:Uncharacterized protein n=1 Tax=Hypsibius exemplaris TaxID=2072580 RepID=A0A1W0X2L4_HYPEX|nr:hypothetical protein BV898_04256 [Hypsibius exemplaris]
MAENSPSPAQLAAQRRRERILSNTGNRMNLVTGKDDQLQAAPEPSKTTPDASSRRQPSSSSQKFYEGSAPIRIFKWHIRILLAVALSSALIVLIEIPWIFVRFLIGFALLEFVFFAIRVLRNGIPRFRRSLDWLFVRDTYDTGFDDYLKIAVIFLGFEGALARYFRGIVMHGMQSSADFAIYSLIFIIQTMFQSHSATTAESP